MGRTSWSGRHFSVLAGIALKIARRDAARLTQAQVAQRVGVSQGEIARMERGPDRTLSLDAFVRWCDALDVDPCKVFSTVVRHGRPGQLPRAEKSAASR